MALSTTKITGPLYMPNGAMTPFGGRISFELSSWDKQEGEEGFVISGPVYAEIDYNGDFEIEVFTSADGTQNTVYNIYVLWLSDNYSKEYLNQSYQSYGEGNFQKQYIGSVSIAGTGPYRLDQLEISSELQVGTYNVFSEFEAINTAIGVSLARVNEVEAFIAGNTKSILTEYRSDLATLTVDPAVQMIHFLDWDSSTKSNESFSYRRSSLSEITELGLLAFNRCWGQSQDGNYWLLDVLKANCSFFGAHVHTSFTEMTHNVAVDSTEAIDHAREYAKAFSLTVYVDGYFKYVGTLIPDAGESFTGPGRWKAGIQFWNNNTETGFQIINDNVTWKGWASMSYLYQAKVAGGGSGLIGNSAVVGNFKDGTTPQPKGYLIDDVLLCRKENEVGFTSYKGIALQISGGANQGYCGLIEITDRHTVAYMSHWTGDNTTITGAITETVHPRYFTIDRISIIGTDVEAVTTYSSVGSIYVKSVIAEQTRKLFTGLPGDEGHAFNIGDPNLGSLLKIDQLVCNNLDTEADPSDNTAFSLSSVSTSKFQTEEGLPLKSQNNMHVEIGELTIHTDDPLLEYGIDLFEFYGTFIVHHATITGFYHAIRSRKSYGNISINFAKTDGRSLVQDSDVKITGMIDLHDPIGNLSISFEESYCVKAIKNIWPNSINAVDIVRGDTELNILTAGGIPEDLVRGATIYIEGTTSEGLENFEFILDEFTESGLSVIHLGFEIPHNIANPVISYQGLSKGTFDFDRCIGARTGVWVEGGNFEIKNASGGRFGVYAVGDDTFAKVTVETAVSGLARNFTEDYSIYDVFVQNGSTIHLSGLVGSMKTSKIGKGFSVGATGSVSTKLLIDQAHIIDTEKVYDPVSPIDIYFGALTTSNSISFPQDLDWTSGITVNNNVAGINYASKSQYATKVGDFIEFAFSATFTSVGAELNSSTVLLPLPIPEITGTKVSISVEMDDVNFGANENPGGYVSGSVLRFTQQNNLTNASLTKAQLTDNTTIRVAGRYRWR